MPLENHTPCTNTLAQPFLFFSICLKGYHSYGISCQVPKLNQEKWHPLVSPHSVNHLMTQFHKGEIFALAESLQVASSHLLVFDISRDFFQENLWPSWELFMILEIKVRLTSLWLSNTCPVLQEDRHDNDVCLFPLTGKLSQSAWAFKKNTEWSWSFKPCFCWQVLTYFLSFCLSKTIFVRMILKSVLKTRGKKTA